MIDQAGGAIASTAAGGQQGISEMLARRGVSGGGLEAAARTQLSEAAQREQARSAAGITVAQQKEQDQMNLARQGLANGLMGTQLQASMMPAQLALQQQQFGLSQQALQQQGSSLQAQLQLERDRMAQQERLAREQMLNQQTQYGGGSYGGGGGYAPRPPARKAW
jgi:hypothetical protein